MQFNTDKMSILSHKNKNINPGLKFQWLLSLGNSLDD